MAFADLGAVELFPWKLPGEILAIHRKEAEVQGPGARWQEFLEAYLQPLLEYVEG